MAVTLNKANLVLKDANGNIGKIEQLSNRDLAKIRTAVSDVALVVNQSNHTPIKATANTLGVVKPDGSTITIDSNGTLTATGVTHAISADSATNATNATNDGNGNNISNTYYPLNGGALRGEAISRNVNDDGLYVCGGAGWRNGGSIYLSGKDKDNENGTVTITAHNGTNFAQFRVDVKGLCTWNGKNIVRSVNNINADNVGNVTISTVTNATNANHAKTADSATNANHATSADSATNANHAKTADSATNANHAKTADSATNDSNGNNISNTYYPLNGGALRGGAISRNVNDDGLYVCGGAGWRNGGSIYLRGKDNEDGKVSIDAHNGTNYSRFEVGVGFCSFNNKNIVRSVNSVNADASGNVQLGNVGAITGEIKWFAFNTVPTGYLVCNGASVSRTTYANLFAVIKTTFGSGDGSTTFTLPNLIGKFAQGSATVGTVKSAGLPNITGGLRALYYDNDTDNGAFYLGTFGNVLIGGSLNHSLRDRAYGFNANFSNSIYGNSTTVQPPALTLLPCIKY